jgi:hypothetical protein
MRLSAFFRFDLSRLSLAPIFSAVKLGRAPPGTASFHLSVTIFECVVVIS